MSKKFLSLALMFAVCSCVHLDDAKTVKKEPVMPAEDQEALLQGAPQDLARVASLNGFPSPDQVLARSTQVSLSARQLADISSLRDKLRRKAARLGEQIVKTEKKLEQDFKRQPVPTREVSRRVVAIAKLRGQIRLLHLRGHLAVAKMLTSEQLNHFR